MENGRLAEHWDVLQDEATKADSKSGLPMFGDHFTARTNLSINLKINETSMKTLRSG